MKRLIFVVPAIALALAGCGSGGSRAADSRPENCESVAALLTNQIANRAAQGSGFAVEKAAAVKSPDFKSVYFVAIRFRVTGVDGTQVGVWASNALDGTGTVFAVDGLAQEFTDWPHGDDSEAHISKADPAGDDARACL